MKTVKQIKSHLLEHHHSKNKSPYSSYSPPSIHHWQPMSASLKLQRCPNKQTAELAVWDTNICLDQKTLWVILRQQPTVVTHSTGPEDPLGNLASTAYQCSSLSLSAESSFTFTSLRHGQGIYHCDGTIMLFEWLWNDNELDTLQKMQDSSAEISKIWKDLDKLYKKKWWESQKVR